MEEITQQRIANPFLVTKYTERLKKEDWIGQDMPGRSLI